MFISIFTGVAAGSIHVLAGADHLVGMAPLAISKPQMAFRKGLTWGLGHSLGVVFLSSVAIFAKDLIDIKYLSTFAEYVIGITLLIVGVIAIRTSLGLSIHKHTHKHGAANKHDHIHLHVFGRKKHIRHSHAITSLGVLHGLAGASHLLAAIPALTLPPLGAILYISGYLLGSIITMGLFLVAISLATVKAGEKSLPLIVGFAGGISLVTGLFWIQNISIQLI